jgi:hypothetical protein
MNRPLILSAILTVPLVGIAVMATSKPLTPYQMQLLREVDMANGAPRQGRDPADQIQTSLKTAASQPIGPGLQVEKPAAKVTGDHSHHVLPSQVLADPTTTGMLASGCLIGFAQAGQKCVTRAPGMGANASPSPSKSPTPSKSPLPSMSPMMSMPMTK